MQNLLKKKCGGITHYLVDHVSPEERYSVARYKKESEDAIDEILSKGKIPIVVGGTGLYVNSLIYGIEYNEIEIDLDYRNKLEDIASKDGLDSLYEMAVKIDPEAMKIISKNDKKRILRVLEIYHATGKTKTEQEIESKKNGVKYDYKVFIVSMQRDKLYNRINERVDIMLENGLVEEVKELLKKYKKFPTAMQALGYKEVKEYLDGIITENDMIEKIKMETRRYAKRQLTWFKRNKKAVWLDSENGNKKNIDVILEEIY